MNLMIFKANFIHEPAEKYRHYQIFFEINLILLTQKLHAAYVAILHSFCNECSFHFIGLVCDDAISYGKEIKWFIF